MEFDCQTADPSFLTLFALFTFQDTFIPCDMYLLEKPKKYAGSLPKSFSLFGEKLILIFEDNKLTKDNNNVTNIILFDVIINLSSNIIST